MQQSGTDIEILRTFVLSQLVPNIRQMSCTRIVCSVTWKGFSYGLFILMMLSLETILPEEFKNRVNTGVE